MRTFIGSLSIAASITSVGFMMGTPDAQSCRRLERHQYSDIDESD